MIKKADKNLQFLIFLIMASLLHLVVLVEWLPQNEEILFFSKTKIHGAKNLITLTHLKSKKGSSENRKIVIAKQSIKKSKGTLSSSPATQKETRGEDSLLAKYLSKLIQKIAENRYYPSIGHRLKQSGTVMISLLIAKDGKISNIAVSKKSFFERLDQAAFKTVKDLTHFRPLPQELGVDQLEVTIPIEYRLD